MSPEKKVRYIVNKMMADDQFSQWLGIRIMLTAPETCILEMDVRSEMLNGFGIAHGAICYALADSAFAFASNSTGKKAVSVETSISHTKMVQPGDRLTAEASVVNQSTRFAIYNITVCNQHREIVAHFKGTVYYTGALWD